ncbi:MAG: hypothetical protein ACR2Q4_14795 [Geminicoccaceae bacterium]
MMGTKCVVAFLAVLVFVTSVSAKDFDPKYVGGDPTKKTAEAMFEKQDDQSAVQFYLWGYAYLNNLGMDKGLARKGGNERVFAWLPEVVRHEQTALKLFSLTPLDNEDSWRRMAKP